MAQTAHSSAAQPPRQGFRSTLRNPYFTRLWLAQIISQTIQNAANYGSIVLLSTSGSVTAVGGVIIAFSLPAVIFGVPAGVLVDRLDKRMLLWISNALRGIFSLGFVVSIIISPSAYVPIYLLTFLISIVGQFFGPAEGAAIPLLVEEGELVSALSLFNITFSLSQALGFVLLGPLIILAAPTIRIPLGHMTLALTSIHLLFIFIGAMYLVCALLTWTIPHKELIGEANPSRSFVGRKLARVWHGVVEAGNYVRHERRLLIAVMQLTLGGTVLTVIAMIAPRFAAEFMNRPAALAAIVFVPAGIGLVTGSVLMPRIIERIGLGLSESIGIIGVAGATLLLTFSHWVVIHLDPRNWSNDVPYLLTVVVLTFCMGLSLDLINLPAQTALQQHSPDWIKGRVLALQTMMLNAATIPIILIVGPAADILGLAVAMNFMAIGVAGLGLGSVYIAEKTRNAPIAKAPDAYPMLANEDGATFKGTHSNPLPSSLLGEDDNQPRRTNSRHLTAH